jgi:hypothetical protein
MSVHTYQVPGYPGTQAGCSHVHYIYTVYVCMYVCSMYVCTEYRVPGADRMTLLHLSMPTKQGVLAAGQKVCPTAGATLHTGSLVLWVWLDNLASHITVLRYLTCLAP